jgi:hypothetical protein
MIGRWVRAALTALAAGGCLGIVLPVGLTEPVIEAPKARLSAHRPRATCARRATRAMTCTAARSRRVT